jgi:uncharacterized Fe-S cluster-containing MiaB family protein
MRCLRFRDLLTGALEIAMGLETVHPQVLAGLNKRMTLEQFSRAASFLRRNGIDLRAFILVQPPLMPAAERRSHGLSDLWSSPWNKAPRLATLIPTRAGNGAMETLAANGQFAPPALHILESAMEYGLRLKAGRVFADLWGLRCVVRGVSRAARDPPAANESATGGAQQDLLLRAAVVSVDAQS